MREIILAIETSCDETSVAVLAEGKYVLSSMVASQIDVHQAYGGVVPEIASRQHIEHISMVVQEALHTASVRREELTAIAVTHGPGLVGALLVGLCYAKGLSYALGLPLVPVHHLEAHIYANFLLPEPPSLPLCGLIVSGGHTDLIYMPRHGEFQLLGQTRDDAAGEAFDKIARVLLLPYPGGPHLEKLAAHGQANLNFPRAWLEAGSLDFSFSGLKSAVINYLHTKKQQGHTVVAADVAASFQQAIIEVLVARAVAAAKRVGAVNLCLAGGVSANNALRQALRQAALEQKLHFFVPESKYCTDNAAMVAMSAHHRLQAGVVADLSLNAAAVLPMTNWVNDRPVHNVVDNGYNSGKKA
ncbi:MAG: tRNA N6-adenosine threonylcarbamoyltransferase [Firmicutes bacterium]|nr:tRNA N6-adenosine threonylcarbamoyltransferase [Bacillota bacterium]